MKRVLWAIAARAGGLDFGYNLAIKKEAVPRRVVATRRDLTLSCGRRNRVRWLDAHPSYENNSG